MSSCTFKCSRLGEEQNQTPLPQPWSQMSHHQPITLSQPSLCHKTAVSLHWERSVCITTLSSWEEGWKENIVIGENSAIFLESPHFSSIETTSLGQNFEFQGNLFRRNTNNGFTQLSCIPERWPRCWSQDFCVSHNWHTVMDKQVLPGQTQSNPGCQWWESNTTYY